MFNEVYSSGFPSARVAVVSAPELIQETGCFSWHLAQKRGDEFGHANDREVLCDKADSFRVAWTDIAPKLSQCSLLENMYVLARGSVPVCVQ